MKTKWMVVRLVVATFFTFSMIVMAENSMILRAEGGERGKLDVEENPQVPWPFSATGSTATPRVTNSKNPHPLSVPNAENGSKDDCEWMELDGDPSCDASQSAAELAARGSLAFQCLVAHQFTGYIAIYEFPQYCVYDFEQEKWCCTAEGNCCWP